MNTFNQLVEILLAHLIFGSSMPGDGVKFIAKQENYEIKFFF